jgi:hypothetical protein
MNLMDEGRRSEVSDELRAEMRDSVSRIGMTLLNHMEYSPRNNVIHINNFRKHVVRHLNTLYCKRIQEEDETILVGERLRWVTNDGVEDLGYVRANLKSASHLGQSLDERLLTEEDIVNGKFFPEYWVKSEALPDNYLGLVKSA